MDGLRAALSGEVASGLVAENLNYYEDYINMEIRKGRTEEEVLSALGDPRLIAKTIAQTHGTESGASFSEAGYRNVRQGGPQPRGNAWDYRAGQEVYQNGESRRAVRLPGWLVAVLVMAVFVVLFSILFSVLAYLAPLIFVVMAVVFLIKLFRDWLS